MKKILLIVFILIIGIWITSCDNINSLPSKDGNEPTDNKKEPTDNGQEPSKDDYFTLSIIDEGRWLIYDRNGKYQEEDIIKFHTYVHPIKIDMYVD